MACARALASSIILVSLLFSFSEAKDFLVGGKTNSWQVPSSPSDSLNQWAEENRFQIGDLLVWKFNGEKDSVLQVTKEDYQTCNTTDPVATHKGGNVIVKLERSGPFYFISGGKGNCDKGEKLIVVVMSSARSSRFFSLSPAPSPKDFDGPAVSPTSSSHRLAVWRGGFLCSLVVLGRLLGLGLIF